jgi:drug/metabolite transporter (DMT)-like permease
MSNVVKGAIFLVLSEAFFALLGALVKYLSPTLDQSQLVFFRNFFALMTILPWCLTQGPKALITPQWKLHLLRSSLGIVAIYCFFTVIANMPYGQAMLVILVSPFIIPIISRFWLGEKTTPKTLVAILIAFGGAGLALSTSTFGFSYYVLIALLGACLMATSKVTIRKLTKTDSTEQIVFYFAALATLVTFYPMIKHWQPIAPLQWLGLISIGLCAALGQILMANAFKLVTPARIGLLTNLSIVFASLLGYLFWGETVTWGLVLGALMIFWAGSITTRQRWL